MKRITARVASFPFYLIGLVMTVIMGVSAMTGEHLLKAADEINDWGRK